MGRKCKQPIVEHQGETLLKKKCMPRKVCGGEQARERNRGAQTFARKYLGIGLASKISTPSLGHAEWIQAVFRSYRLSAGCVLNYTLPAPLTRATLRKQSVHEVHLSVCYLFPQPDLSGDDSNGVHLQD